MPIYQIEMFYLISTLHFGIPPVLVFQLDIYYKVDRLLTGLTAQPKGTTARWYLNKTSLCHSFHELRKKCIPDWVERNNFYDSKVF